MNKLIFLLLMGFIDAYEIFSKGSNLTTALHLLDDDDNEGNSDGSGNGNVNDNDDGGDGNGGSSTVLKREKRFLLWAGNGISKSVLGILVPVVTADKVNWRTMNMAYNFQAQFVPIPRIIYPWTRFERSLYQQKETYEKHGTFVEDKTRQFAYAAVELMIDRRGKNGRQCLLRAICEAAHIPVKSIGLFDEILHLFLTPNENEVDSDYMDAMLAGKYGADCIRLYSHCPVGHGLLDTISYFST